MTVTEEQAKTKWCPMVRYSPISGDENYRKSTTHTEGCIGSGCMMWAWVNRHATNYSGSPNNLLPEDQWQGRCGLAKP